jgi:periplasmic divalent cation tolerance protein
VSAREAEVRVVLTTAPDRDTAARLARVLVEERLAACVNLVPGVRSVYRWQGRVEEADEILLVVKTRADRADALARRVSDLHPYELPELLTLGPAGGSDAYLRWVMGEAAP